MIGSPKSAPKMPGIRDRERAALHFVRLELLRPRARGEILDAAAEPEHVLLVRVADDRHDQPGLERDGDARG